MRDQFGRTIEYMRVSVTDRCNLRCVYCMPPEGVPCLSHGDILTYDEITRICRAGTELGISRIKLTGGEPLVRRGLPDLVGMLREIPGIEQITLTTNGILLKEKINELVSNGINSVNISMDSLDAERYEKITRGGCLRQAFEGLEAALAIPELQVRINCVCLSDTQPEDIIRLALLADKQELDVRFIEMMPIGLGKNYRPVKGAEIRKLLEDRFGTASVCQGRYGNGPAVYVRFPGFKGKIGFIDAVSHQFCSTCNRVRLTSEGCLKSCLQYETGADLRTLLRSEAADEKLKGVMRGIIYEKPACHQFAEGMKESGTESRKLETRDMSQIGG